MERETVAKRLVATTSEVYYRSIHLGFLGIWALNELLCFFCSWHFCDAVLAESVNIFTYSRKSPTKSRQQLNIRKSIVDIIRHKNLSAVRLSVGCRTQSTTEKRVVWLRKRYMRHQRDIWKLQYELG